MYMGGQQPIDAAHFTAGKVMMIRNARKIMRVWGVR